MKLTSAVESYWTGVERDAIGCDFWKWDNYSPHRKYINYVRDNNTLKLNGDDTTPTDFWCLVLNPELEGNFLYPECSSSNNFSSINNNNNFSIISTIPADGDTGVSKNTNISIRFSDNVSFINNVEGYWVTNWTSNSYMSSCSGIPLNEKNVHVSVDNFTNCIVDNGTVNGDVLNLRLNSLLPTDSIISVKVYKTSIDGLYDIQSNSGDHLEEDYIFSFKTEL